jgi:hypothetical protein
MKGSGKRRIERRKKRKGSSLKKRWKLSDYSIRWHWKRKRQGSRKKCSRRSSR